MTESTPENVTEMPAKPTPIPSRRPKPPAARAAFSPRAAAPALAWVEVKPGALLDNLSAILVQQMAANLALQAFLTGAGVEVKAGAGMKMEITGLRVCLAPAEG